MMGGGRNPHKIYWQSSCDNKFKLYLTETSSSSPKPYWSIAFCPTDDTLMCALKIFTWVLLHPIPGWDCFLPWHEAGCYKDLPEPNSFELPSSTLCRIFYSLHVVAGVLTGSPEPGGSAQTRPMHEIGHLANGNMSCQRLDTQVAVLSQKYHLSVQSPWLACIQQHT